MTTKKDAIIRDALYDERNRLIVAESKHWNTVQLGFMFNLAHTTIMRILKNAKRSS